MLAPEIKEGLNQAAQGRVRFDAPLASLTSFGLGGEARALVEPDSEEELARVLVFVRDFALDWVVLGGGSNVLVDDRGFDGVVIRLGKGFGGLAFHEEDQGPVRVLAGASVPTPSLLALCRKEGLTGLEFLAGIPGWVGGALAMNAGTRGQAIADRLVRVWCLNQDGKKVCLEAGQIQAGYRSLGLPEGLVVIGAEFRLERSLPAAVDLTVRKLLEARAASQPKGVKSAGCVFRNPPGNSAGRLIDQAGLKGLRIGGAWVSEVHANFIVHQGQATAAEVMALMEKIEKEIQSRFDLELAPEIRIIGKTRENDKP